MDLNNIKKLIQDLGIERHRVLTRWRYHIIKHPEEYDKYIEIKTQFEKELTELREKRRELSTRNKTDYFKKYYDANRELIKEKARNYSREVWYPKHREEKLKQVKEYQAKVKVTDIYFPDLKIE